MNIHIYIYITVFLVFIFIALARAPFACPLYMPCPLTCVAKVLRRRAHLGATLPSWWWLLAVGGWSGQTFKGACLGKGTIARATWPHEGMPPHSAGHCAINFDPGLRGAKEVLQPHQNKLHRCPDGVACSTGSSTDQHGGRARKGVLGGLIDFLLRRKGNEKIYPSLANSD